MRRREAKIFVRARIALGGSLLSVGIGLAALYYIYADPLARLSYDLPFAWRSPLDTDKVVLVYLDDLSAKQLNQPLGEAWNRALHAQLIDRLTSDGARLAFFDIVFDAPAQDASIDDGLAQSISRNGHIVLGAAMEVYTPLGGVSQERILPPTRLLRKAAAGWGLLAFRPVDPDYAVRQMYLGNETIPTATWRAAENLGASITQQPRETSAARWLNYYGPAGQFASVSFVQVVQPEGLPSGFFKDKVVFVGGRSAVGYLSESRDEFATPYSRIKGEKSTGLEIHATILLNLLRGEWLARLAPKQETALVIVIGALLGLLALIRPLYATFVAVALALALSFSAWWLMWNQRIWFSWLVPVAMQIPVGLFWSLGSQYYLESRRRKELRRAFGFYLSPQMADRIANSDFDLTPGGKTVEATIMFTDLENFTAFSEDLNPAEVSKTLIDYFERTSRCILERKGTIVKYVGDAVMVGWGAPIEEPAHALLAAEAACDLRCLADIEFRGLRMRTRVGVNTGQVLAGNLGSSYRFDYTMIGDTTNFASRLEALNKHLRTQVLISETTRSQMGKKFLVRRLGEFRAAGKTHSVLIHELICRCDAAAGEREWIELFEQGLAKFREGDFARASDFMKQTEAARGGNDGPAAFYLKKIAALNAAGLPDDWLGIIEMTEK
ncbi:MAG: CHASE2 domain-containing protein [Chthoniobacterales bacterium]